MRFGIKSSAKNISQWKGTTLPIRDSRGEGSCISLTVEQERRQKSQAIWKITTARVILG